MPPIATMNRTSHAKRQSALLAALLVLAPAPLLAQPFPTKPVRLIVPFPPGGSTDFVGRAVAQSLSESLGHQVVVDNRGGAGAVIGTMLAAKAAPDGYTLLLGSSSGMVTNPLLHAKLPYDPFRDFDPVIRLNRNAQALVATLSLPANDVKALIALAKARPGQLNIASPGRGSSNHVGAEMLKHLANIDIVHVPYKGAAPAVVDLLAGNVQLQLTSLPSVMAHIKAGRLKILGVGSPQRSALLPQVPTIAESGVPGYDDTVWFGLFAPRATPPRIVELLNAHLAKALGRHELSQRLLTQGAEPFPSSPRELSDYMRAEHARWAVIIKAAGIRLD